MNITRITVVAAALLVAAGCTTAGDPAVDTNVCDGSATQYDVFESGLAKVGEAGVLQVKLAAANPAPPLKGDNAWQLQLLDSDGQPLPDGKVTKVSPYMPDHGHGTNVAPLIGELDDDAMSDVTSIDFMMPGVWTITVEGETGDGTKDSAVFSFCVDG